jgi:hypothetical protein
MHAVARARIADPLDPRARQPRLARKKQAFAREVD